MDTFIRTDNGYRVTAPEGFVAIDRMGDAVKQGLEFSGPILMLQRIGQK